MALMGAAMEVDISLGGAGDGVAEEPSSAKTIISTWTRWRRADGRGVMLHGKHGGFDEIAKMPSSQGDRIEM